MRHDPVHAGERLDRVVASVATTATDAVLITDAEPLEEEAGGPRIVYANEAFSRMTGYAPEEVLGRTPRMLQCEETDRAELARIGTALRSWEGVDAELLNRRRDGSRFWVEIAIAAAVDERGTTTHWVSVQREITRRKREEHQLGTVRERLRSAFDDAPIGMAIAAPDGRLLQVNPALGRLLGRDSPSLIGGTLFALTHPDDVAAAYAACDALREDGIRTSRIESRFLRADGAVLSVLVSTSRVPADGVPEHLVMHVEDITERTAMEAQLTRQALHDPLTGLPNRGMLLDRLHQALGRSRRDGGSVGLLFVDLDGFKALNDAHGHAAGDELLMELASRLSSLVRPGDTVARFGGDEFVVLCEHADEAEAEAVAGRLREAAARPVPLSVGAATLSASIGVATAAAGAQDADALVRDADGAMYEAKRLGGDRVCAYRAELGREASARRATAGALRDGIERGELCLAYQPQRDLASGAVTGVEALVRWCHPQRGLLLPGDFISVAEDSGLILPVGRWVLKRACADAATWSRDGTDAVVWVNVSARQLSAELPDLLRSTLEASGLAAHQVGCEITESVLMEDLRSARRVLGALRELGVQLAIDDFGTGYSSLAYLAELPVDAVKVDRSFAAQLDARSGRTLITAIVGMARGLGLDVIAEGVETAHQLAVLHELGVDRAQGFHVGLPGAWPPAP